MNYILDREALLERAKSVGIRSISALTKKAGLHRNTLLAYFRGKPVFVSAISKIAAALDADPVTFVRLALPLRVPLALLAEIRPLIAALLDRVKGLTIVLLGSRAKGTARPYSDWDLGVTRAASPLRATEFLALRRLAGEFAENLARGVDLVNLDAAPDWFWEEIDYEPVYLDGDKEGFAYVKGVIHGCRKNLDARRSPDNPKKSP